jgi:cell wall-associated NlpC family hydrolase
MNARRQLFTHWVLDQLGLPALWAAKGERVLLPSGLWANAYDCSGLYTCGVKHVGGPDLRVAYNTDRLWNELPEVQVPEPGDAAFYGGSGPKDVEHVAIVVASGHVVCASGASSHIVTLKAALEAGARVRVYQSHLYRKDFRGFRRSTYLDQENPHG